jgi:hypothetical protein
MTPREKIMSRFLHFITLDDSLAFLNELRGLPDIPVSAARRQRLIRSSIILGWVAVEEALDYFIDSYSLGTRADFPTGSKLLQRLEFVARANQKTINLAELATARRLRNDVTHARDATALTLALTEQNCQFVFETCLATVRAMCRYEIVCSVP